jgi:SSS family solute:Na+ symporter/sodium/pantothenate symporter
MRYLELIADRPLIWSLFVIYLVATAWLAWLGHRKTDDIASFAVGKGDMHPAVVGITLAAATCSTATFVINPGFVFAHGVSALMHMGVATGLGIAAGLLIMSPGVRRFGATSGAITLPQWLGQRFGSRRISLLFALLSFLSLSFVVLIVGGISIVLQKTLGLTNTEALVLTIGFVFSYITIGGAYAHAYTNTLQGIIMVIVTIVILASGLHHLADGAGPFLDRVATTDPNLASPINPTSSLFGSFFAVYVAGFVIGFAVVCQPHIMSKALYVKTDRAVRRYLYVALGVTALFLALLFVGLFARADGLPADLRQDAVMTVYITETFPGPVVAVITVALLAASMSTLDGILVALSSIAANDLYLPIAERRWLAGASPERRAHAAHRASQIILVGIGLAAFAIALDPPELLGIFGQLGVYGLIAASAVPILTGVLAPGVGATTALASSLTGLAIHFGLYAWGRFDPTAAAAHDLANPGVTATWAILASALVALPAVAATRLRTVARVTTRRAEVPVPARND